jgi:uncharacterized protein
MNGIPFIDTHVHAQSRSCEDFARLAAAGCIGVVAVAGPQAGFRSPDSLWDHLRCLARVDRLRVEGSGLKCWLALGIHPLGIPETGLGQALSHLADELLQYQPVALGEIGWHSGSAQEEQVLDRQLEVACANDLRVIIHTPREKKVQAIERILSGMAERSVAPHRVILDHLDQEVVPDLVQSGCYLGLSIHPGKLAPQQAADLVAKFGPGRFVLNTDLGASPSYLFGIPAAISAMQDLGLNQDAIRAVVHDNAAAWLGLSL